MKFGKSLSNQIEVTLPEWRDKFLSYKDLKKRLKLIDPKEAQLSKKRKLLLNLTITKPEEEFLNLLEDELHKFNSFFLEKEEEYIIILKELQDRVANAIDFSDELMKIRKEIVDFHGEMVLLENYSALNYTGLVKILKKYDKRTGALLRLPFIQKVLQQPFFTTDLLFKLVKECEAMLDLLFTVHKAPPATEVNDVREPSTSANNTEVLLEGSKGPAEIEYMESLYMKSIVSALRALEEIRSKSSTVSVFSLPPLQSNRLDDAWKKFPLLEQVAK